MADLALERVTKIYPGHVVAIGDFDLRVTDGELVVLLGPSGCGKSTTLRVIAGLEDVTSGTIRIGGRVVNTVPPKARGVAMVFQDYALYPHMSVRRNLAFGPKLRKVPRAETERRVRETAAVLGLADLLERMPATLSGGQRQRVALGRAMVSAAACCLFDEPLGSLDARMRNEMRAQLKALHARLHTTSVYVTHDQEEAMALGDRVVVMSAGRIRQTGAPLEVYRRPADRFVAGFLGSPPMNFIPGRLEGGGTGLFFVDGHGLRWGVSADRAGGLDPWAGREVVAGLRPEALCPGPQKGSSTIELRIDRAESLGGSLDVHAATVGGAAVVVRLPAADGPLVGHRVFSFDPEALHLFEPGEFGRTIG